MRSRLGLVLATLCVLTVGSAVSAQSVDVTAPTVRVDLPADEEGQLERLIDRTLADADVTGSLDWFWSSRVTPADGLPYRAVESVHPYLTGEAPSVACAPSAEEASGNAFFCALDHSLAYDLNWLRDLYRQVGPAAPVTLLAHEWGHHVASLQGSAVLSVRRELQADCYAGMFIRALVDNGGLPLDGFTQSLRLFDAIGDDPGSGSAWSDPLVHGAGVQRRQAEGVGYEATDTQQCLGYNDWAEQPPVSLDGDVSLQLPPAVTATFSEGRGYLLTMPGGRVTIDLAPATGGIPSDTLLEALRSRLGDSVTATLIPGGFLDAQGWSTGSGARVTFTDAAGTAASGVAAIQSGSDGIDRIFLSTSDDGQLATADAQLAGLLWGYCEPAAADTSNCPGAGPGSPDPTPRPTPRPTSRPTARPRPTRSPAPPRSRTPIRSDWERLLLREAPSSISDTCKRYRGRAGHDPFSAGAVAAISCDVRSGGVEEYAAFQFVDQDDLDDYYYERLLGVKLDYDAGGYCPTNRSEQTWAHGRVVCWVSRTGSRLAHIRWTDDRTLQYGLLDASDRDLDNLYDWWLEVR